MVVIAKKRGDNYIFYLIVIIETYKITCQTWVKN